MAASSDDMTDKERIDILFSVIDYIIEQGNIPEHKKETLHSFANGFLKEVTSFDKEWERMLWAVKVVSEEVDNYGVLKDVLLRQGGKSERD